MDITNKMLLDLAGDAGIKTSGNTAAGDLNEAKHKAEQMKGKSEDELLAEIMELKKAIKKDRKTYEQQLKTVKALKPMMNAEQRSRLERIIKLLEE